MKKIITAILATLLLSAGLVAATQTTSVAGRDCGQYTGCVRSETVTQVNNPLKKGKAATVKVRARLTNSNGKPRGQVRTIVRGITGPAKGYRYVSSYKSSNQKRSFVTPKLTRKGKYIIRGEFKSPAGSTVRGSQSSVSVRVR